MNYSILPVLANYNGEVIELKEFSNVEEISKALNDIYYICITENVTESYNNLAELMLSYGDELPPMDEVITDVGIALYYEKGCWNNYFDLENKFYKLENQFNKML